MDDNFKAWFKARQKMITDIQNYRSPWELESLKNESKPQHQKPEKQNTKEELISGPGPDDYPDSQEDRQLTQDEEGCGHHFLVFFVRHCRATSI